MISYYVKTMDLSPADVQDKLVEGLDAMDAVGDGEVMNAHVAVVLQIVDDEWQERIEAAAERANLPLVRVE